MKKMMDSEEDEESVEPEPASGQDSETDDTRYGETIWMMEENADDIETEQ